MTMYDLAVVIPAFNESASIKQTLDMFSRDSEYRTLLIVVDNNSSDDTAIKTSKWILANKEKPTILLVEKQKGSVYARYRGMIYAKHKAKVVLSTDADMTPLTGFYKSIQKNFLQNQNADVLCGHLKNDPEVRLLKRIYLPNLMNLIYLQEKVEVGIFGPVFFGGYFAIKSSKINDIALPVKDIANPFEPTPYWSKHCYYLGYKFIESEQNMVHSNRRFWVDPIGSIGGTRVNPIREPEINSVEKRKMFEELHKKELLLITERQKYFSERLLFFLLDAIFFETKCSNKKHVKKTIQAFCNEFEIEDLSLSEIQSQKFLNAKNFILKKYLNKVNNMMLVKYKFEHYDKK